MPSDTPTIGVPTPIQKRLLAAKPRRSLGPVPAEEQNAPTGDRLDVSGRKPDAPPSPQVKVPGEATRNRISIVNAVLGPLVTAQQTVGMLASTSFSSPLLRAGVKFLVDTADVVGRMPFLAKPLVQAGFKTVGRGLPFVSAGLLAFDGFAMVKTLNNPEASGLRKALTIGRFVANAVATGVSFIPGAGFVYALAPALVGNGFEVAMARMNAKQAR